MLKNIKKGAQTVRNGEKPMLQIYENNNIYYVGETADIKAMYKSIRRKLEKDMSMSLELLFVDFPKFNPNKSVYALCVDERGYITVVNSDTMMSIIVDGYDRGLIDMMVNPQKYHDVI